MNNSQYSEWTKLARQVLHKYGIPTSKMEAEDLVSDFYLKQIRYVDDETLSSLPDGIVVRGMSQIVGDLLKKRSVMKEISVYDMIDENTPGFNVDEILSRLGE